MKLVLNKANDGFIKKKWNGIKKKKPLSLETFYKLVVTLIYYLRAYPD